MTKHNAFKINFKSPVFGKIDSIKIYGAILNALYLLDETKAEKFKKESMNKQIKISSAFPLKEDVYFFPMPILNFKYSKELSDKIEAERTPNKTFNKLKKIKKIQYVSKSIFEELINKNYDLKKLEEKINLIEENKITLNELETEKWHLIKKYDPENQEENVFFLALEIKEELSVEALQTYKKAIDEINQLTEGFSSSIFSALTFQKKGGRLAPIPLSPLMDAPENDSGLREFITNLNLDVFSKKIFFTDNGRKFNTLFFHPLK